MKSASEEVRVGLLNAVPWLRWSDLRTDFGGAMSAM